MKSSDIGCLLQNFFSSEESPRSVVPAESSFPFTQMTSSGDFLRSLWAFQLTPFVFSPLFSHTVVNTLQSWVVFLLSWFPRSLCRHASVAMVSLCLFRCHGFQGHFCRHDSVYTTDSDSPRPSNKLGRVIKGGASTTSVSIATSLTTLLLATLFIHRSS